MKRNAIESEHYIEELELDVERLEAENAKLKEDRDCFKAQWDDILLVENRKLRRSRDKLASKDVREAVLESRLTGEPYMFGWTGEDSSKYYKTKAEAIQSWIEWSSKP